MSREFCADRRLHAGRDHELAAVLTSHQRQGLQNADHSVANTNKRGIDVLEQLDRQPGVRLQDLRQLG